MFAEAFKRTGGLWIMKPVGRCQGRGIFMLDRLTQAASWKKANDERDSDKKEIYVVSKYIERPLLVGGKKFDLRLYALVLSYSPLKVYLHRGGFARFSGVRYTVDKDSMKDLYVHLTNVAIQKKARSLPPMLPLSRCCICLPDLITQGSHMTPCLACTLVQSRSRYCATCTLQATHTCGPRQQAAPAGHRLRPRLRHEVADPAAQGVPADAARRRRRHEALPRRADDDREKFTSGARCRCPRPALLRTVRLRRDDRRRPHAVAHRGAPCYRRMLRVPLLRADAQHLVRNARRAGRCEPDTRDSAFASFPCSRAQRSCRAGQREPVARVGHASGLPAQVCGGRRGAQPRGRGRRVRRRAAALVPRLRPRLRQRPLRAGAPRACVHDRYCLEHSPHALLVHLLHALSCL
jgi:Tubulin-tyrosine ligase family